MNVSTEIISKLNPCKERFSNYLQYYKDFNGTLAEFIALDKISYEDKVWVFCRLASKTQLQKWSILCAESVLDIYESKYPNDFRPRNAINAAKDYISGKITKDKLKDASDAADTAAYTTAYASAGYAADAAYSAARAAVAYAAFRANAYAVDIAYSSADAVATREIQENKNLQFMLEVIK